MKLHLEILKIITNFQIGSSAQIQNYYANHRFYLIQSTRGQQIVKVIESGLSTHSSNRQHPNIGDDQVGCTEAPRNCCRLSLHKLSWNKTFLQ